MEPSRIENVIHCAIKNVHLFKICLESVKFSTSVKQKFNVSYLFTFALIKPGL